MGKTIAKTKATLDDSSGLAPAGQNPDNTSMEKTAQVFGSFEEADRADARLDASLTPQERLQIAIELRDRRHPDAAEQGLARVCRVVELERS